MGKLVKAAPPARSGDAAAPIDVDADGADDDATFRWQADGGSAGWMDFDDASNAVASARDAGRRTDGAGVGARRRLGARASHGGRSTRTRARRGP